MHALKKNKKELSIDPQYLEICGDIESIGENNPFALLLRSYFGDSLAKEKLRELKCAAPGGIRGQIIYLSYLNEGLIKGNIIEGAHKPTPTETGKKILEMYGLH